MYDIYLYSINDTPVNLQSLPADIDDDIRSVLRTRLLEQLPGFLGFDLPIGVITTLRDRFRSAGASGFVLSSAYRHPKITMEMAHPIAEQAIMQKRAEKYPQVELGHIQFLPLYSYPMWWTFGCRVEEWIRQGLAPGMLFASVDKLDGHVWQQEEKERFLENSSIS